MMAEMLSTGSSDSKVLSTLGQQGVILVCLLFGREWSFASSRGATHRGPLELALHGNNQAVRGLLLATLTRQLPTAGSRPVFSEFSRLGQVMIVLSA